MAAPNVGPNLRPKKKEQPGARRLGTDGANRAVDSMHIGEQSNHVYVGDPFCFSRKSRAGVGNAALPPMLLDDDVGRLPRSPGATRRPFAARNVWRATINRWAGVGWFRLHSRPAPTAGAVALRGAKSGRVAFPLFTARHVVIPITLGATSWFLSVRRASARPARGLEIGYGVLH
jgi:hypothetical protein